jgi:predicted XRE-type DNA-binding protein
MSKNEPIRRSSGNVFADLGFAPQEAENLRVRAELMMAIKSYIKAQQWTQQEAARRFGVAQPRISEIFQGKIGLFTVDKLIKMLAQVGQQVSLTITDKAA